MLHLDPFITAYVLFMAALLGLVMGSFLCCMASRIVSGGSVLHGRSQCDACGHVLQWRDLVPLLSWLFSRGRCRYCGVKLPARYPLTELVCSLMYLSVVWRYDVSLTALMWLLLLSALFPAALVDLDTQLLPDRFVLFAGIVFFPMAYFTGGIPLIFRGLLGAAALFVPVLLIVLLFDKLLGRESMGGGDLKLIALLGLYFGWQLGILLIIVACIAGLILAALLGHVKNRTAVPFGPALAVAAWFTAIFGDSILKLYLSLF